MKKRSHFIYLIYEQLIKNRVSQKQLVSRRNFSEKARTQKNELSKNSDPQKIAAVPTP